MDAGRERGSMDSLVGVAKGPDQGLRNNDDGNHHAGVTPGADVAPTADGQGNGTRSRDSSVVEKNDWASGSSEPREASFPDMGRLDLSHQDRVVVTRQFATNVPRLAKVLANDIQNLDKVRAGQDAWCRYWAIAGLNPSGHENDAAAGFEEWTFRPCRPSMKEKLVTTQRKLQRAQH